MMVRVCPSLDDRHTGADEQLLSAKAASGRALVGELELEHERERAVGE